MERPSHLIFARHSSLSRTPWLGLAIVLQLAGAWLFVHGLATGTVKLGPHIIEVSPAQPEVQPKAPPPAEPKLAKIEVPRALDPIFKTQSPPPTDDGIRVASNPPAQTHTLSIPSGVERAVASIAGTHTVPPYPPAARRQGLEGMVTLRLTVGTDGRVSAAEIVTSAGSTELDQVAREWILSHWRYRPALKDGNPAPAQLLASVTYNLKNQ
jgi:protein TonB